MKEFKGTPGPWEAIHNGFFFNIKPKDCFQNLADTQTNEYLEIDAEVERCNANLIAAAPDLLEALQELFDDYEDAAYFSVENSDIGRKVKSVIARALGKNDGEE